jgi:hypothetical protein
MDRRDACWIAAVLFVTQVYFYQGGGWNQNTRLDLTRAIVERGSLRIDDYRGNTGDAARWNGHWYADKAPGQSLMAVPVAALVRAAGRAAGVAPGSRAEVAMLLYAATIATSGVATVVAALLVLALARRLGASRGGAIFAALGYALATPAWAYGTLFWGHQVAAAGLVGAFACATALGRGASPRRELGLALGVGLCAGWAVVTELPAAPAAAILAAFALARGRSLFTAVGVAAGAVSCAAVLLIYNSAAFGAPLHLGYQSVAGFPAMQEGFAGVTYPRLEVLGKLLFGRHRGLLLLAPFLLAAPLGPFLARPRAPAAVALAIVAYYLLFNAAYAYWDGGWCWGPRFIAPALPFACLLTAPVFSRAPRFARAMLVLLALAAGALELVAVSTTPQPPSSLGDPAGELLWPAFRDGQLALNRQRASEIRGKGPADLRDESEGRAATNLGLLAGLPGLASLAPLAAALAAGALALARAATRRGSP